MNRTNPAPALALALSLVCTALTIGCPMASVACASDDECGADARCFVANGAGACRGLPSNGQPAEPAPAAPAPAALELGRVVVTGGGRVQGGGGFTLRGSLTTSTKASSTTFTAVPRSVR